MQAIVQHGYGTPRRVLRLRDIPVPQGGAGEVRVRAASMRADVWTP